MRAVSRALAGLVAIFSSALSHADWYTGVNLGANFTQINKQLSYPNITNDGQSLAAYQTGFSAFRSQFFGGYNFRPTAIMSLALEADVNVNAGNSKETIYNYTNQTPVQSLERLHYGWGFFLLPKYNYSADISFFAGPGFERSQFSAYSGLGSAGFLGLTNAASSWLTAWALKVGTEMTINPCTDLLITYQYSDFQSLTAASIEPHTNKTVIGIYRPNNNSITLGLSFHTL